MVKEDRRDLQRALIDFVYTFEYVGWKVRNYSRFHSIITTHQKKSKTYNSGYSPVVTHLTTNPPVHRLSTAERTGSAVSDVLWSYVKD